MEFFVDHFKEILAFIGGLISGITIKIWLDKSRNSTTIRGNLVGGDLAGRDIRKK